MTLYSIVENSVYENITSTGKGGAICDISSNEMHVLFCSFVSVCTDDVGGGICKSNGKLRLEKCSFLLCRTTNKVNNEGGNTVFGQNCVLNCTFFCASKSWISTDSGDSCIASRACNVVLKNANSSDSTHLKDYSGILIEATASLCEAFSYCGCYRGSSHRCFYFSYSDVTADHINMISTKVDYLAQSAFACKMKDCYIFNNTISTVLSSNNNIVFENSYGDIDCSGVTKVETTQAQIKAFTFRTKCRHRRYCTKMQNSSNHVYCLIFVFLRC